MKPANKEELRKLVSSMTVEAYEELAPQAVMELDQIKHRTDLTDAEKSDEILLAMVGYVKACTNEMVINVLAQILDLPE